MLGTLFFVCPSLTAMVGISYKHYIFVILPNENRDNKQKNNSFQFALDILRQIVLISPQIDTNQIAGCYR